MSWDGYITNLLAVESNGFKVIGEAAICGYSAGQESVWASTPGMKGITPAEIKKLASDRSDFSEKGVFIAGKRYVLLRDELDIEGSHLLDLKSSKGPDNIAYSLCIYKTSQAFVIGLGSKDAQGGQVKIKVHNMGEYLRKSNY